MTTDTHTDDQLKAAIDPERLPSHVAIIMDGNGRWARRHGKSRIFGHRNGVQSVRNVSEAGAELGIECLTLYAFSTENWNRPALEVSALMELLVITIDKEIKTLMDNDIRLKAIGDLSNLPGKTHRALEDAMDRTSRNTRMDLYLALSYSGRAEIVRAVRQLTSEVQAGRLDPNDIDEAAISARLDAPSVPEPELLIRTSGEQRISNFLLWQTAYTEYHFTSELWPDFSKASFYRALLDYQSRERRFGKTSEQITKKADT